MTEGPAEGAELGEAHATREEGALEEARPSGEGAELGEAPTTPTPPRRRHREPRRFPGWILIPLGGAAGWFFGGWGGLAFGAVVGFFLWRTRA